MHKEHSLGSKWNRPGILCILLAAQFRNASRKVADVKDCLLLWAAETQVFSDMNVATRLPTVPTNAYPVVCVRFAFRKAVSPELDSGLARK